MYVYMNHTPALSIFFDIVILNNNHSFIHRIYIHIYMSYRNVVFFGTGCQEGEGKGLVVRIGDYTAIGEIARATTQGLKPDTLMKLEIERFVLIITYIACTIGFVFFIIAVISGYGILEALVFTIGIIVANVPEGLLATVTVALTITAQRMASKEVLVKTVETVETLGSVTVIASDKTGTLTQNRMTVRHAMYHNGMSSMGTVEESDTMNVLRHAGAQAGVDKNKAVVMNEWKGSIVDVDYNVGMSGKHQDGYMNLVECAGLCNHAQFIEMESPLLQRATNGDASESALLKFAHSFCDGDKLKEKYPEVACIPFNSVNKWMITIHKYQQNTSDASNYRLVMKGAPEKVLAKCSTFYNSNNEVISLASKDRLAIDELNAKVAGNGERVLALAEISLTNLPEDFVFETDDINNLNFPIDGLRFIGMLSLEDPPREEVPAAVACCHHAGMLFHRCNILYIYHL